MHCDENDIVDYLKGWPGAFISAKEIARKVGGKELFDKDRGWALPYLAQLVRQGVIETDHLGHYRLIIEERKKKNHEPQHISPQILNILKSSGKSFEGIELNVEEAAPKDDNPIPAYPKQAPKPAADAVSVPFNPDGAKNS